MIRLSLDVEGLDTDRLKPIEIQGTEELSTLYYFDVLCTDEAIGDVIGPEIMGRHATLTIALDEQTPRIVQGVVETMSISETLTYGSVVYRLRLSPSLCRLKVSRHNQIFGTFEPISVADVLGAALGGVLRRQSQ